MKNLLLACTMGHAGDWLVTAPIPGLGLSMPSDNFRMALKFRLGLPLFDAGSTCPATSKSGDVCGEDLDVFGDHALCCHYGTSRVFRHNNLRDILGHAARGAGLAAVVIEKKNQITGSNQKPGDITVQQYHRGFSSTAFDVTVTHPLQKNYIEVANDEAGVAAQAAHDNKLKKALKACEEKDCSSCRWPGSPQEARPRQCTRRLASGWAWRTAVAATRWTSFAARCTLRFPAACNDTSLKL